jgi:hypothetical protein
MKLSWLFLSNIVFVLKLRKKKVLVAKWDSIEKHIGYRKAFDGMWSMDPKCEHAKNEIANV